MLDELSRMMGGGSIELLAHGRVVGVLRLSDPAAMPAFGGEIEFNDIARDPARGNGTATSARIVSAYGTEILSCNVGDEDSDAVVKLNTTTIVKGGSLELLSFRLGMP